MTHEKERHAITFGGVPIKERGNNYEKKGFGDSHGGYVGTECGSSNIRS